MDASKRANRIFKQWLNRYQLDKKTLISFADSRFIHRYSDKDRNGIAKELLARSLRRGWIYAGLKTLGIIAVLVIGGWKIWDLNLKHHRGLHDIGMLVVHNDIGADLTLQRIQHYGKNDDKSEMITLEPAETYLKGPAYYRLSAEIKEADKQTLNWSYPVYIRDEDSSVTITIKSPQDQEDMANIPAGAFSMGDKNPDGEGNPDEDAPLHKVYLDAFQIDKTEVSHQDYEKFMLAKGYETTSLWKDKNVISKDAQNQMRKKQPEYWNDEQFDQDDHPVAGVSWFEARAYCRWNGKQLPTEAQWEKAARGREGYEWSFGNVWDETKANSGSEKDGFEGTAPVKHYQPNSYGLYNMSGNVWEWVQDAYQADFYNTTKGQEANPVNNPAEVEYRVLRGGSWNYYNAQYLRASHRNRNNPNNRNNNIGFRCASTPAWQL